MKKISWKRIIAITGIVALLFSNLSDVVTVFADDTVQAAEAAATEQEAQVQAQQESEPVQVTQSPAEPAAQDENQDNNQDNNRDEAASGDDTSVTTDGSETAASSSSNKEEESETAASGTSGKEDGADGASSTDAATEASSDAAEEASTTEAADTSESSASDKSAVVEKPEEAATGKTILTEVDNTVSVKGTCKAGDETIKGHESFAIEVSGTTNPSSFAPSIDGYTFTGEVTLDDNKVSKIRKETKEETTTSERTVTNNTESESVDAEAGSEDNSGSADQNTETPATLAAPENSGTASSSESSESASTTVTDTNITKTTFISYSTDGESYTKLTSDTTLVFHYTKDAVAEKKTIAIYGKCVDTDNAVIKGYEKKELTVDDTLDLTKAPFEIDGYTYKEAKIDDAVVSSIDKKTEAADDSEASGSEEASSDSSSEEANTNAGSEGSARNSSNDSSSSTVTYSYTADGKTHELTEDTTITFVYKAEEAKAVKLTATYVDKYGDAIDDEHTDVDLSEFKDDVLTIAAGEDDVLPEKIQIEKGSNKKVIEHTYAKSYVKISGSVKTITSIKREKMDDGYAYYVKGADDSEYTALKKDTTVYFRYTDGSKSEYTYEDSKVKVTATLQHANAIPDDAEFKVTPVTKSSKDYNYDAYMAALNDNADKLGADSSSSSKTSDSADAFNEDNTLLYDIAFMGHPVKDDGTVDEDKDIEFQPAEGSVKIEIEFKKDQLSEELGAEKDEDVIVAHLPLDDAVKNDTNTTADATDISASDVKVETVKPETSVNANTVGFDAKSFSVYSVSANPAWNADLVANFSLSSALGSADGYGVIANEYYQEGDTETNVMVGYYNATAKDVGASGNYSNAGGNDYIGAISKSMNLIQFYQAPANLYLGSNSKEGYTGATEWYTYYRSIENQGFCNISGTKIFENSTISVPTIISGIGTYFSGISATEGNTLSYNDIQNGITVDLTGYSSGTYVLNYSGNGIPEDKLNIKINANQTLIFNCTTTDSLTIGRYKINDRQTEGDYAASTTSSDDNTIKSVIFSATKATNIYVNHTVGVFIAPLATATVNGTCAGIIVSNNYSHKGGEWHYHNHELPSPTGTGFEVYKSVNDETPSTTEKSKFTFNLYELKTIDK